MVCFLSETKPEGGFRFISVFQLCALWSAYRAALITRADLQVWFAAHEMVARRCGVAKTGHRVSYTNTELCELTGRGGIRSSCTRLTHAGVLNWSSEVITFPATPSHETQRTRLEETLKLVPNCHRQVPVPRRLLRFLARGCSRVLLATILGHLFRCLYYREGKCRPDGLCKASWIAEVFGVSERAVKSARQRLEAIGFLTRTETKQWVRNRYGQKMTINLHWEIPTAPRTPIAALAAEVAPLPVLFASEIAPPDSNKKLLRTEEEKHQEPVADVPHGFLSTLFTEMREHIRNGTAPSETAECIVMCDSPASNTQKQSITPQAAPILAAPSLTNVVLEDLRDTDRLLTLYHEAMGVKLIGKSEAEQLAFFALARHVIAYGPTNPGGLFRQLLSRKQFQVITQEEEEDAMRRLKRHLYGKTNRAVLQAA